MKLALKPLVLLYFFLPWFFFCKIFAIKFNAFQDTMWIGYPLSDDEPTIIHHFMFYEDLEEDGGFVYPHFANGFAMRIELMDR